MSNFIINGSHRGYSHHDKSCHDCGRRTYDLETPCDPEAARVEAKWRAWAHKIRRQNFWRSFRTRLIWALVGLVVGAVAVVACVASTIDVVI